MTVPASNGLPPAADRVRTLAQMLDDPAVLVDFAPGACAYERSEVLGGPDGPRPAAVVRAVVRNLGCEIARLDAEPDDQTGALDVFYVLRWDGPLKAPADARRAERVARVYGLGLDAFVDALVQVACSDWRRAQAVREAAR